MRARIVLVALFLCSAAASASERAVLVYPRERSLFRRVFYTRHQTDLTRLLRSRYLVDVHRQVATDEELFSIDVDGAKLLVISGHGDPFSMYLGGNRTRTLDATDRDRLARFLGRLDPHAVIVLQSCETGRGFAHLVKEAAGPSRRVIAARGDIPWNGLRVTSVAPFDVTIQCDEGGRAWDCTVRL